MTRLTPEQIAESHARIMYEAAPHWLCGRKYTYDEWAKIYPSAAIRLAKQAAALLSHIESDGWQTMETAPTEGYFLAWSPDHPHLCMPYEAKQFHRMRRDGTPRHLSSNHITHWRPLPAPPEIKE